MEITFKLYASLTDHLPPEARSANQLQLDVGDTATVDDVVEQFRLPPKLVHLVLINGHFVPADQRDKRQLAPGDVLAIWPPIAGG